MASGTESEVEDVELLECVVDGSTGVSISKEKAGTDMESKPKESAVWIYFEKMDQVGAGYRVASCKDYGKAVKILKGNTTNLMSHLRTKHPKVHEEMRQKPMKRSVFISNPSRLRSLMTCS